MTSIRPLAGKPAAQHASATRRGGMLAGALALVAVAGLAVGAAVGYVVKDAETVAEPPAPVAATSLPSPADAAADAVEPCENEKVTAALERGDPDAVLAAFGGAETFRGHVAGGTAPCIALNDGRWPWLVVNKHLTLDPVEYVPQDLTAPEQRVTSTSMLRKEATAALNDLVEAAAADGAGDIAATSGYRSYGLQQNLFDGFVASAGVEAAEATSAHPGHSEHQTGLAVDVVPCGDGVCGTMDDFGSSAQGRWTAKNAWRFGYIVRYEEGHTDVSGYDPEPWHLRYIGVELAETYHEGGYHTLEEFFGLDPAPDYR